MKDKFELLPVQWQAVVTYQIFNTAGQVCLYELKRKANQGKECRHLG